jgi:hypothetical protein
VIAYFLMADPTAVYEDVGPDWFGRRSNPDAQAAPGPRNWPQLGYHVELQPAV